MGSVFQALSWPWHYRMLGRMTERSEFAKYIRETRAQKFLSYQAASKSKRVEFLSVLSAIHVKPKNLRFLDLGPGYGDSLDVCHEMGAKSVAFTEIDPFFVTHNRLKKFTTTHRLNHLSKLHRLPAGSFDLIWCKGANRWRPGFAVGKNPNLNVAIFRPDGSGRETGGCWGRSGDLSSLEKRRTHAARGGRPRKSRVAHDVGPRI